MTTEQLLQELKSDTWVHLRPSPLHGIGVFALRDIPKGCTTFFSKDIGEWIKIPIREIEALPTHSRHLVETYCLYDESDYYVPDYGFKVMDLVNFLNHSSTPNIRSCNDGLWFESVKDIKEGEELLVNYGDIVDVDGYL